MLRLSKMADYALVVLVFLLRRQRQMQHIQEGKMPEAQIRAQVLAMDSKLPEPTVSKVLKILSRQGLLSSRRGSAGGYRLARSAQSISVADVVLAMDGPIALSACADIDGKCEILAHCPTHAHWPRISQTVHQALAQVSLAEMAKDASPHALTQMVGGSADAALAGQHKGIL